MLEPGHAVDLCNRDADRIVQSINKASGAGAKAISREFSVRIPAHRGLLKDKHVFVMWYKGLVSSLTSWCSEMTFRIEEVRYLTPASFMLDTGDAFDVIVWYVQTKID